MNIWLLIAGCVAGTVLVKAAGPVLLGGRELPPAMIRVVALMAPALLAALVVTAAFVDGRRLHVGSETVGMLAGGVLLWRGRSVVLAVLLAVLVTAGLRALV
jgi:branched-subunit amino acid transport protein